MIAIHVCEPMLHGLVFIGPLLYQLMLCVPNLHSLQRDADLRDSVTKNLNNCRPNEKGSKASTSMEVKSLGCL